MPLLSHEPESYPADIFDRPYIGEESHRTWWAIHTRPRREKELARRLQRLRSWYYLPQHERKFLSPKGRKCVSYLPLFPGYLFLYGAADDRFQALTTGCVARVLEVPDGQQMTFDLCQIKNLLEMGAKVSPESRIGPGSQVRVISGPFAGFEGRVLKRHSGDILLVVVSYLQQGITISLDDYQVEPI